MSVDLSILVVSYNCKNYIEACVNSVVNYKGKYSVEVVVVDNNSSDGTLDVLRAKFPDIKFVANKYNYGFSVGMNQAYRLSSGRYVMSFNPDAEISSQAIDTIIEFMDNHPEVGKGAPLVENTNGSVEYPATKFTKWVSSHILKTLTSKFSSDNPAEKVKPGRYVEWLFGTGIVMRRSILPQDYIYQENSFLFWEEYWLSKYVISKGYKIAILPEVKIIHHASVTFKFNPEKIYWARALSNAVGWRVRVQEYGKMNAILNALIAYEDYALLSMFMKLKNVFAKNVSPESQRMIADYQARSKVAGQLLFGGEKTAKQLEAEAYKYFNNGVTPPPLKSEK
jgi:GT2 family glycosyltransferase